MLNKVKAESAWSGLPELVFNILTEPETDLFQIRDIRGLGPVKASINTTQLGSIDQEVYNGASVGARNIVMEIGFNADWDEWTVSKLRDRLDKYFMPKLAVRLVFESDERVPVEINGYVESAEPSIFDKDPTTQVSIICPDPYFRSVDAFNLSGTSEFDLENNPVFSNIQYNGSIATGFNLEIHHGEDPDPIGLTLYTESPLPSQFMNIADGGTELLQEHVDELVPGFFIEMNSIAGNKYIEQVSEVDPDNARISILRMVQEESSWLTLKPGVNPFFVYAVSGEGYTNVSWNLTYYERFGSL